jgi:hypothetical protein
MDMYERIDIVNRLEAKLQAFYDGLPEGERQFMSEILVRASGNEVEGFTSYSGMDLGAVALASSSVFAGRGLAIVLDPGGSAVIIPLESSPRAP